MKVNFNKTFKDAFGNEAKENGQPVVIGNLIAQLLFGGSFLERSGKPDDGAKLAAYRLSTKIAGATGEVEITAEDAVMIKQAAVSTLTPGTYGQIYDLLEK